MRLALLRHEFNLIVRNKKNILLLLFLTIGFLTYIFLWLPKELTSESLNYEEVTRELEVIEQVQKTREERRATGFSPMAGRNYYADTYFYEKLFSAIVYAYDDGDFDRYAHLRTHYLNGIMKDYVNKDGLLPDTPFPVKDLMHSVQKRLISYEYLIESGIPITYEIIEGKSAIQTINNLLYSIGPYILIFLVLYFSNDILVRDRRTTTTLEGLPITWYQLINSKSLVALVYTSIVTMFLLLLGIVSLTMTNGFGSLALKVPALGERIDNLYYEYILISSGKYIFISFVFIIIFWIIFNRLSMIFSLLFRNEWIVLTLGILLLFSEKIYYARDKRELFGKDLSLFPQTYVDIGNVITGEKNFLLNIDSINYLKGLFIVLLFWLFVEICLYLITKVIDKRRFYQQ